MKPFDPSETWESVSRRAYWDRNVPLERWRERVSAGHPAYLPGAVTGMSIAEFIHFYGTRQFLRDWPGLRTHLPENIMGSCGTYDLAWSRLVGGGWNLKPVPDFYAMPARRRHFFIEVARVPGRSIYEIAKTLGMQYRRAHEHAVNLIQEGKIRGAEVMEGGRQKTRLYPAYASA